MSLADTMPHATDDSLDTRRSSKSDSAYRTISEVASELNLPQHVLRFWESKFKQISPLKRGGGRRYYRPQDVDLIKRIHYLLHTQGYTIKGVQKLLSKDRLLQNSVPIFDNESARINIDAAIQRPPEAVNDTRNQTQHDDQPLFAAIQSNAQGPLPLATRTDLQLIVNRLKNLRAQISKTI